MVLLGYICTRLKSILFNVEFMSPSISHYLLRLYNLYIVCLKHKEIYIWLGEGGAVEHGYWIIQPTNAVYWFWFSSVHLFTFVSNIFYLYCFIGCVVIYCFFRLAARNRFLWSWWHLFTEIIAFSENYSSFKDNVLIKLSISKLFHTINPY